MSHPRILSLVPFEEAGGVGRVDEGRAPFKHFKLTFVAERPPPSHMVSQEFFWDSEASADYFS